MNNKKYTITIKGKQSVDGESFHSVLSLPCSYDKAASGCFYARYREAAGETGQAPVQTTLKAAADRISIHRSGGRSSHMIFENGKNYSCHYDTGMGTLFLDISTQFLSASFGETGGSACLHYLLLCDGRLLSEHEVSITIKEDVELCQN